MLPCGDVQWAAYKAVGHDRKSLEVSVPTLIVDGEKFEALPHSLREAKARHVDKEAQDGGRSGARAALTAALQFIRLLPGVEEERLHIPIANLATALRNFDRGLEPSLFERPKRKPGARPHPDELHAVKCGAAAAMECYYRAIGLQPDAAAASARDYAARRTVSTLRRRGWKYEGQEINAKQVARAVRGCAESVGLIHGAGGESERLGHGTSFVAGPSWPHCSGCC